MKFNVDRSKWVCGKCPADGEEGMISLEPKGIGPTTLLNEHGFMCCLGHVSIQLGCKPSEIRHATMPRAAANLLPVRPILVTMGHDNSDLANAAAAINDNIHLRAVEREKKLTELFARHGHELTFSGEYVSPGNE